MDETFHEIQGEHVIGARFLLEEFGSSTISQLFRKRLMALTNIEHIACELRHRLVTQLQGQQMDMVGSIGLGAIPLFTTFCRFLGTRPLKGLCNTRKKIGAQWPLLKNSVLSTKRTPLHGDSLMWNKMSKAKHFLESLDCLRTQRGNISTRHPSG